MVWDHTQTQTRFSRNAQEAKDAQRNSKARGGVKKESGNPRGRLHELTYSDTDGTILYSTNRHNAKLSNRFLVLRKKPRQGIRISRQSIEDQFVVVDITKPAFDKGKGVFEINFYGETIDIDTNTFWKFGAYRGTGPLKDFYFARAYDIN